MRVQRFGEHRAMPWANGLGTSYEVASDRNVDGVWTWRVAIAPVVLDGPFSVMPGVDRQLVVINGEGMTLSIDGEIVECPPGQVVRFSGDSTTEAHVIRSVNSPDNQVVDLGLMTVRSAASGQIVVVEAAGSLLASDLVVALTESLLSDGIGTQYGLGARDALVGTRGSALVLLQGSVGVVRLNS